MTNLKQLSQWAAALGFLLLATTPLQAGVVYEIEVTDHEQSPPRIESIETAVEGRHLKMGMPSMGQNTPGEMIFRGDRREMVVVDHDDKSYVVMDEAAIRQIAGQVNNAMSQMQEQMQEMLKDVPADQRAAIEAMMKQQMPAAQQPTARPRSELKKTGERAKKNGYPCVKYEVLNGGRKTHELWVTDWSNIEGGQEVVGAFEDMADFFSEMIDAMPEMGQDDSDINDNMFEFIKEMGGYPVLTREFGSDGALDGESALRSARRQTFDPEDFEPPSGYKRQEMFGR